MIKYDKKLNLLPFAKRNPHTLKTIFNLPLNSKTFSHWIADQDFALAYSLQKALIARIENSGFGYEYRPDSYFSALINWYYDHYGLTLKKENLLFSPSVLTSIALIIKNFSDPQDGIIIQPPVYMRLKEVILRCNRQVVKNPLCYQDDFYSINFDNLEEKVKDKKNKILILCNPHNPIGIVWSVRDLERIFNLCQQHDTLIISDEIHKDIILFNHSFTSLGRFQKMGKKIFIVTSENKTFNLASLGDSLIISFDKGYLEKIKNALENLFLTNSNALANVVIENLYRSGKGWLKDLIYLIEKNILIIKEELDLAQSKIKLIFPQATFLVWLDFRNIYSDSNVMFEEITKKTQIALSPGHWFGQEGALAMRMNVATSSDIVLQNIRKIIKMIKKY